MLSLLRKSKIRGLRDFEVIKIPRYIPNFEEAFFYSVRYVFYCFPYDSVTRYRASSNVFLWVLSGEPLSPLARFLTLVLGVREALWFSVAMLRS